VSVIEGKITDARLPRKLPDALAPPSTPQQIMIYSTEQV